MVYPSHRCTAQPDPLKRECWKVSIHRRNKVYISRKKSFLRERLFLKVKRLSPVDRKGGEVIFHENSDLLISKGPCAVS